MDRDLVDRLAALVERELAVRSEVAHVVSAYEESLARRLTAATNLEPEPDEPDEPDEPEPEDEDEPEVDSPPPPRARRHPLDVGAVRRDRRQSTSGPPDCPAGAVLAGPGSDRRFVYIDPSAPEAMRYTVFLRDLLAEAPHLHSITVMRGPLGAAQLGNLGIDTAGDTTWITITLADDLPRFDPEAERVLRHELGHLVHVVSAGEDWRKIMPGDQAEIIAAAAEAALSAGTSAAAYLSAMHSGEPDDFSYGRAPRWCSGGDGAA